MKVLIISNYQDAFNSIRPEGELFIGLQNAGLELTIMTQGDAEFVKEFKRAGIRVIDFFVEKKISWSAIQFIRKELIKGEYDILHLFYSQAISNGSFAAIGLNVKVLTYRGVVGITKWYNPNSYLKHLHPRVDGITAASKAVQKYLQKHFFWNKNKVKQFYKGQNLAWYKDVQKGNLTQFDIPKNGFVVACIANVRRWKGIRFLIQATDFLPNDLPIHFLLIGRNMDNEENLKLIEKSNYKNNFHLVGYRNDAVNLVAASQTYIQPSYGKEGLGKGILEAMSLGVPPIVTNSGGPPEFVENEKSGFVIPTKNPKAIAEAILKLYKNEELRGKLGNGAKAQIGGMMSTRNSVKRMIEIYEEVLSHPD